MTTEEIELGKNAQQRVAGLVVGIMSIKPGEDDPAVRLGLRNLASGDTEQAVFVPGIPQHLLEHTVEVVSIIREPAAVRLRAEPTAPPGAAS